MQNACSFPWVFEAAEPKVTRAAFQMKRDLPRLALAVESVRAQVCFFFKVNSSHTHTHNTQTHTYARTSKCDREYRTKYCSPQRTS